MQRHSSSSLRLCWRSQVYCILQKHQCHGRQSVENGSSSHCLISKRCSGALAWGEFTPVGRSVDDAVRDRQRSRPNAEVSTAVFAMSSILCLGSSRRWAAASSVTAGVRGSLRCRQGRASGRGVLRSTGISVSWTAVSREWLQLTVFHCKALSTCAQALWPPTASAMSLLAFIRATTG